MRRAVWILALAAVCLTRPALAKGVPTCKSPRNAVDSVFVWQQGVEQSLTNAAKCLEPGGRSQEQLEETARRLKMVFDAEGAVVDPDKISDDPEYLDDDKNARFVPHASFPRVSLERRDGSWQWTRASLDWIDQRYEERLGWLDKALEAMPAPAKLTVAGIALWQYAALAVLLALGVFASKLLHALLVARVKKLAKDGDGWRRKVVDAVAGPVAMVLTAACLRMLYPELRLPVGVSAALHTLVRLLVTFALVWAAYRGADVLAARLSEGVERSESRLDDYLAPILRKAIKAGVFLIGVVAMLQNLSIDVTALFATLGIGTLAIGLAAKDTLANLFGSLSIFVDNPFKIGDWINVDGVDGIVEEVGFRSTRLRTFYNSVVVIPNAKLADAKIDNYGKRQYRRCQFTLSLAHGTPPDKIEALCRAIRELIEANPRARRDKCEVFLTSVTVTALEVATTFFFVGDPELQEAREKHDILLAVLGRADELGIALARPLTMPDRGGRSA